MHVRCHAGGRGELRRKSLRYSGLSDYCAVAAVQCGRRGPPDTSGVSRNTGSRYSFRATPISSRGIRRGESDAQGLSVACRQ